MQEIERRTVPKNSFKFVARSPEGSPLGLFEVMEMYMSSYCVTVKNYFGCVRSSSRSFSKIVFALMVLTAAMSCVVAEAQTATTTTLAISPTSAANGSVFDMTATVKAGGTALTGGTVTFRDTYNGVTEILGTVQVQSAHGIKGNAVLQQPLGGIGTHSVVATFNAPKTFSSSFSSPAAAATVTGFYPTTASLLSSGGSAGNWSLTTTILGIGTTTLSPTGTVSLLDTSNANLLVGTGGLGTGTVGHQTVVGGNSPIPVGRNPQSVVAGDFDGDGYIDLAVLNASDKSISILIGNGAGKFTASTTKYATGTGPVAIVTADFNGDGKLDLAVANSSAGAVGILLGNGDGTFNAQTSYAVIPLVSSTSLAVGDFDGDGVPDLAVAGKPTTGGAVVILEGDGNGGFTDLTSSGIAVGNAPSSIAAGDFNRDGNLDFAVANKNDNSVSIMRGDGSGTSFTASTFNITNGSSPTAIIAVDLNADGYLDLVVAESNNNRVDIYKGSSSGTFTLQGTVATGTTPMSIVAGDFNADGKIDLAVANFNSATASVLLGNGDLTFQPQATPAVGTNPFSITTGDFNGDGSADLAVANNTSNNVSILLNEVTDTASVLITGVSIPGSGNHNVEASYPGDSNFNASISNTLSLAATKVATTELLSASTTTPTYGQQVVLTATLQNIPMQIGALIPTGTVTFKNGGTTLGSPVTISGGVATLNTTSLTINSNSITATYSGDTNFAASPASAALNITVSQATPTIAFTVANKTYGASSFTVAATSNSTGAFTYSVVSGQATVSGSTVTLTGAGTVVLQASEAADSKYVAATQTATFSVSQGTPTIAFTVSSQTYGTPFTVAATSNSTGAFTYSVVSGLATVSGNTVTPTGVGTVVLQASEVADSNYIAGTKNATFTVAKGTPTITFSVSNQTYGVTPFTVAATSNSTGAFTYSVVSGPATVSGSTVTLTGVGTVVLKASEATSTNYVASTQNATFTVGQGAPTITWANPAPISYGMLLWGAQLNASSPVAGSYSYSPSALTLLTPGTHTLNVVFTPTSSNYTSASSQCHTRCKSCNSADKLGDPSANHLRYGIEWNTTQCHCGHLQHGSSGLVL